MGRARRIGAVCTGLVAVAVFVGLAYGVMRAPGFVPGFDQRWHDNLRAYGVAHPTWLATWNVITHLGASATVLGVDAVLVIVCGLQRRWALAAFVAVVGFGGWGLRILLRNEIDRPRPVDPLWSADGSSFPSGH